MEKCGKGVNKGMSTSTEKINKIISQIEAIPEKSLELAKENKKKTTEEIIKIFLNNETEPVPVSSTENLESEINFYFDMEELQHWRTQMNQTFQIPYYREIPCFRKHFRKVILFVKRGIRKACRFLLEPVLTEQSAFNMNTTSAINALTNNEIVTESFIYHEQQKSLKIQKTLEACEQQITQVSRELNHSKKNTAYESEWNNYKKEIEELKKQNQELFAVLQNYKQMEKELEELKELKAQWSIQKTEENVYEGIDYFDFEDTFRGERKKIKKELSIYLPYFKQGTVVDLGCGRGEFLELLMENEIEAVGIDNYQEFIDYCRKRGLNVKYGDVMEYLTEVEDNSLGGIFNAQLVEHLESKQLNQFCHLAYQKLKLGASFVIETPNPMCLSMFTNAFYIDPSHNKPIHPKLLEYLVKKEGFAEVQILFPEYCKNDYRLPLLDCAGSTNLKEFNDGMGLLSDILFGSENYAIIAKK